MATPSHVPPVWWLLGAGALAVIAVQILRLFVPRPERTGIQLEVAGGASLEPADPANPLRAALGETTLRDEVRLHGGGGRGMKGRLQVLLPALAKRLFWPGRQALIVLRPRVQADTDEIHSGMVRLVTSPRRRRGILWSSTAGWRALPDAGAGDRLTVNLAFKLKNQPRVYQVPVTLRILRLRPEARPESGPGDGNGESRRARGDGALQRDRGSSNRKG